MPHDPLDPSDPRSIGRYRVLARLGEGGQGVVYLGADATGEQVAIKVLKHADASARARFAREMAAARQVDEFCTAAVRDVSVDGREPYVVSEYIDGPSLAERVRERGPLSGGGLRRLANSTATALAAIHAAGIVHRDFKPANVLLGSDGPRVVDFGIARSIDAETHTQMVGTPAYFAPEWLAGRPPTPASDVFAWAGTMVYAATGRPPFGSGPSLPALMNRIAHGPPDLAGVPPALAGLLAECLDKDPRRRPTARDLMMRLVDLNATPSQPLPQPWTGAEATGPLGGAAPTVAADAAPPRRRRTAVVAVAAAAAVLVVAAGVWLASRLVSPDAPPVAASGPPSASAASASASASASSSAPSGTVVPAAFAGTWKGTIVQEGGLTSSDSVRTPVTLTLKEGESRGHVSYEGWNCAFDTQVTEISGDVLTLRELGGSAAGSGGFCVPGEVTLTRSGGGLAYSSGGAGTGDTTGDLRKT
ncbi:serine/threonine-protein kinase [Actinomadura parmotrematis]|uniref:non-specific serine/threonine protein kinase n=1 Tax=Actinomadura parmotrematis TaxID=2864039 RepID=A0ABS7FVJ1_9ACTN|nr:serine/threonine-protein kinase [Actinomadura parmotrematis]MBW8484446.1 serine/threonine protein kinase [Actinomadura parmotrematis]